MHVMRIMYNASRITFGQVVEVKRSQFGSTYAMCSFATSRSKGGDEGLYVTETLWLVMYPLPGKDIGESMAFWT